MLNLKKIILKYFTVIFALIFIAGLQVTAAQGTVVDVISESEDHSIFSELLAETQLDQVIAQPGPFTVLAPTNDAFEAMGTELDQIRTNPDRMQNIVIGHLFQGEVSSEDVIATLEVNIEEGDIPATNGIVHVTDEVIMGQ